MPDPLPLSIHFEPQLTDYLEATDVLHKRTFISKYHWWLAALFFGIGVLWLKAAGPQGPMLIWFLAALLYCVDPRLISRWRARVEFERNPMLRDEYHLTFTPQNIRFQTSSIDSTLQWSIYHQVRESPHLFLLLYGQSLYTLVPKRAFQSQDEMNKFRELTSSAIPTKAESPVHP